MAAARAAAMDTPRIALAPSFDLLDVPSTARSPQQMFGAIAKTYFADKIETKREDLVVVSIMPCLAKKYELFWDSGLAECCTGSKKPWGGRLRSGSSSCSF